MPLTVCYNEHFLFFSIYVKIKIYAIISILLDVLICYVNVLKIYITDNHIKYHLL